MEASPAVWVSCCGAIRRSCFTHGNFGTVPPYFQAYEICFPKLIKAPQNLFLTHFLVFYRLGVLCVFNLNHCLQVSFASVTFAKNSIVSSGKKICHHCPNATTAIFVGYICSLYHYKIIISPVVPQTNCLELGFYILWFYSA